tara:strand:- start:63 stop:245 length:183 start_codon:yes stop_codon:yes gene_type:complete
MLKGIKLNYLPKKRTIEFIKTSGRMTALEVKEALAYTTWRFGRTPKGYGVTTDGIKVRLS